MIQGHLLVLANVAGGPCTRMCRGVGLCRMRPVAEMGVSVGWSVLKEIGFKALRQIQCAPS